MNLHELMEMVLVAHTLEKGDAVKAKNSVESNQYKLKELTKAKPQKYQIEIEVFNETQLLRLSNISLQKRHVFCIKWKFMQILISLA